jgi:hypothetical protein
VKKNPPYAQSERKGGWGRLERGKVEGGRGGGSAEGEGKRRGVEGGREEKERGSTGPYTAF